MGTFLDKYQAVVPVIQKLILQRGGRADLAANIPEDGITQLTTVMEQHGRSNPRAYNEFLSMLYIDLAAAYGESQVVDDNIGKADTSYKRAISYLRDGIKRLDDKLQKYQHLINLGDGNTSLVYETFVDDSARETARKFYANPPVLDADIDHEGEALTLPKVGDISRIRSPKRQNRIARFEMDAKLGTQLSLMVNDTRHGMDKAIDQSRDSFWAETVLSSRAIRIKPTWMTWMLDDEHPDRVVVDGAACKCHVMFQFKSYINRIVLKPFSHGPMTLVACYSIPNDNDEIALQRNEITWIVRDPIELKDNHIIHFPRHMAKRVYFVFQQRNYVRNIYHVPRIQQHNIETWNRIAQSESELTEDLMAQELSFEEEQNPALADFQRRNKALSQRKVDEISGYNLFLEYMTRVKNWILNKSNMNRQDDSMATVISAMSSILKEKGLTVDPKSFSLKDLESGQYDLISMSALEYVYGLYDLEVDDVYYTDKGYYITKAFKVPGRAVEFRLRFDAEIPAGTDILPALSYNHNDDNPLWRYRAKSQQADGGWACAPQPVYWPDNSDFTAVTERFNGGIGTMIVPNNTIYVHPVARAESVMVNDTVRHINYSNANRAYEPLDTEFVEGMVSQVKWNHDLDPATFPVRDTAISWALDVSTINLPLIMEENAFDKLGITDDEVRATYILDSLPDRHRVYYRPLTVKITNRGEVYGPDPYGEPYFIEDKNFTLPITHPMLMANTIAGHIRESLLTTHVQEDPQVGIITNSGAQREIDLLDVAWYISPSDLNSRIKQWDSRIDTKNETTINISGVEYNAPVTGIVILGVKKWLREDGAPFDDQNIAHPTEAYIKPYEAEGVINGSYYDVVYPVLDGRVPVVNIKFDEGVMQALGGWEDDSGNQYPYLGFVALKLDHFIPHQEVITNPSLGVITKNVTDYRTQKKPRLKKWNFDSKSSAYYPVIEYYHDLQKNKIQFAAQLPTEWIVDISYATYAPDLRVRFDLTSTTDASPVIGNFMVEVKEA